MSTLRALSIAGLLLALLPASLALGADGTPAGGGEGEEPSFFERLKAKLLRSENSHVERGNEHMAAAEHAAALEAYNSAARELPAEGGVHLDRGLALLATGDLPAAREALSLASHPPASKAVRADAYYNLGLAFYTEADQLAASEDHQGAQQLFREAVDALKRSLRLRPGDPNTAWNYELALRRLREEEQKQQEQEQDQDQQNQDQQNQDQQQQDQQQQDQQQDQQQQDQQQQQQQDQQQQDPQQQPQPLPQDVEQALDALQHGEENLERLKALRRAQRERRKPAKDW